MGSSLFAGTREIVIKKETYSYTERLPIVRRNVLLLLHYGKVTPFQWHTKGLKCFYCQNFMPDPATLIAHTNQKHTSVDLLTFIPRRVRTRDIPIKVDVANVICNVCDEPVDGIIGLIEHIIDIHNEDYDRTVGVCVFSFLLNDETNPCVVCGAHFDNFSGLLNHMYKMHMIHMYMCQMCGLSFVDRLRLQRHIAKSHVEFNCELCGIKFEAHHKMVQHKMRVHGKLKNHPCTLCNMTFPNLYQVKVHMGNIHCVEKYRIKCKFCPKIATTKGAMLLHVQSIHSERNYECDICEYRTAIKWMIKLHKRKHFGEKNYLCTICSKKFGRSSNLRAHFKVHTGKFGRVCRHCRQGFIDADTLAVHDKEYHYMV